MAGIINPDVFAAAQEGRLGHWLVEQDVDSILLPDRPHRLVLKQAKQDLNLKLIADAPPQNASGYRLYRVKGLK